jgi:hypothetical protein
MNVSNIKNNAVNHIRQEESLNLEVGAFSEALVAGAFEGVASVFQCVADGFFGFAESLLGLTLGFLSFAFSFEAVIVGEVTGGLFDFSCDLVAGSPDFVVYMTHGKFLRFPKKQKGCHCLRKLSLAYGNW